MLRPRLGAVLALAALACLGRLAAAAPPPKPPPPPETGYGSEATRFAAAVEESVENPVRRDLRVFLFRPAGEGLPETAPVVLFAHGFGAVDPGGYRTWLAHMARNGALVVFPVYPGLELATGPTRYDVLWAGFEAGLAALEKGSGPKPDRSRAGFVGHSFGGGAANAMAARAAARGVGSKALWVECLAPWDDRDPAPWASLPSHAWLLAVAFADDRVCDPETAASFLAAATAVPAERKRLVVFRSDAHGAPALVADHLAPLTAFSTDALDRRGTWRLDDALRDAATTGSEAGTAVFLDAAAGKAPLGAWSDGVPVAAPAVGAVPPEAHKDLRAWTVGGRRERWMRAAVSREARSTLPLPDPAVAPASRLPVAERVARDPPEAPWPAEVAGPAKDSHVLVVAAGPKPSATLAAVEAAIPTLSSRGVRVVRAAPDSAAWRTMAPREAPSVLLLGPGGDALLWKEGEEPRLAEALLDLVKAK